MEETSFVLGWNLDGTGGGVELDQPNDKGSGPTWLHFDYSKPGVENELLALGLHPWVIESLVRVDTRPRTAVLADGVLVLLRGINMNPGADPEDMVSLRLWFEPGRLISVRQRRLFAVQDVSADLGRGRGPDSIQALVVAIVEKLADRIARDVEDLDLVRERALVITEELLNRIAQEQNSRMYVLSIIAAIFLPITFITGLFGMNVAGLPGLEHSAAFLIVTGVMVGVTAATFLILRANRWF